MDQPRQPTMALDLLPAWRESPIYTARERAALDWTEALTKVAETGAPDSVFDALKPHFTDKEVVDLTVLVGLINLLNRLGVAAASSGGPWLRRPQPLRSCSVTRTARPILRHALR